MIMKFVFFGMDSKTGGLKRTSLQKALQTQLLQWLETCTSTLINLSTIAVRLNDVRYCSCSPDIFEPHQAILT